MSPRNCCVLLILMVIVEMEFAAAQDNSKESKTEIVSPRPQPYYMESGNNFVLECHYTDNDAGEVALVWMKDTTQLQDGKDNFYMTKRIDGNTRISSLRKTNATLKDTATYTCRKETDTDQTAGYKMQLYVFSIVPMKDVIAKVKDDLELQCDIEGEVYGYKPMHWYTGDTQIVSDKEKYVTSDTNDTLLIKGVVEEDIRDYICGITIGEEQEFNGTVQVESEPHVKHFDKSKNLVQGDPLTLDCHAWGVPTPDVTWLKEGEPIEDDDRVSYRDYEGVTNATIRIENLDFEDRAEYTCVADNRHGASNSTILVRVKDKLAALWPFLGICAEVAILCIIIFIYERRRAKKMEEEEQQEEAGHLTNSNDHKGKDEIRHRK